MSDIPTGVTGQETRPPRRIGLLLGLVLVLCLAVAFLAASLWLYANETRRLLVQQDAVASRLVVDQLMLRKHWAGLEEDASLRQVAEDLGKQFGSRPYKWQILDPSGVKLDASSSADATTDPSDREMLDRLLKSEPPAPGAWEYVDRLTKDGNTYTYFYYQPMRAQQSCLATCHQTPDARGALEGVTAKAPGEVLAVVKITLSPASFGRR